MDKTSNLPQNPPLQQTAVKCRFFAQYWKQKYQINNQSIFEINERSFPLSDISEEKILLKSLNNIEKDDLISICGNTKREIIEAKLISMFNSKGITYLEVKLIYVNGWSEFSFPVEKQKTIDYLRLKGYAVPFMEYSVEDLISFGWVRLV